VSSSSAENGGRSPKNYKRGHTPLKKEGVDFNHSHRNKLIRDFAAFGLGAFSALVGAQTALADPCGSETLGYHSPGVYCSTQCDPNGGYIFVQPDTCAGVLPQDQAAHDLGIGHVSRPGQPYSAASVQPISPQYSDGSPAQPPTPDPAPKPAPHVVPSSNRPQERAVAPAQPSNPQPPVISHVDYQAGPDDFSLTIHTSPASPNDPTKTIVAVPCDNPDRMIVGNVPSGNGQASIPLSLKPNTDNCVRVTAVDAFGQKGSVIETHIPYTVEVKLDAPPQIDEETGLVSVSGRIESNFPVVKFPRGYFHTCGDHDQGSFLDITPDGEFSGDLQSQPGDIPRVCINAIDEFGEVAHLEIPTPELAYQLEMGQIVTHQLPDDPKTWLIASNPPEYMQSMSTTAFGTQPQWKLVGMTGKFKCDAPFSKGVTIGDEEYRFAMKCDLTSDIGDATVQLVMADDFGNFIEQTVILDNRDSATLKEQLAYSGLLAGSGLSILLGIATAVGTGLYIQRKRELITAQSHLVKIIGPNAKINRAKRFHQAQQFAQAYPRESTQKRLLASLEREREVIIDEAIAKLQEIRKSVQLPVQKKYQLDDTASYLVATLKLLEETYTPRVRSEPTRRDAMRSRLMTVFEEYVDTVFYDETDQNKPRSWEGELIKGDRDFTRVIANHDVARYCYDLIHLEDADKRVFWKAIVDQNPELAKKLFNTGIAYCIADLEQYDNPPDYVAFAKSFQHSFPVDNGENNNPFYYFQTALDRQLVTLTSLPAIAKLSPSEKVKAATLLIKQGNIETGARVLQLPHLNLRRVIKPQTSVRVISVVDTLCQLGDFQTAQACVMVCPDDTQQATLTARYQERAQQVIDVFARQAKAGTTLTDFQTAYRLSPPLASDLQIIDQAETLVKKSDVKALLDRGQTLVTLPPTIASHVTDAVARGLDQAQQTINQGALANGPHNLSALTACLPTATLILKASQEPWYTDLPYPRKGSLTSLAKQIVMIHSSQTQSFTVFQFMWAKDLQTPAQVTSVVEMLCQFGDWQTAHACITAYPDQTQRAKLAALYEEQARLVVNQFVIQERTTGVGLEKFTQKLKLPDRLMQTLGACENLFHSFRTDSLRGLASAVEILYPNYLPAILPELNAYFQKIAARMDTYMQRGDVSIFSKPRPNHEIDELLTIDQKPWFQAMQFPEKAKLLYQAKMLGLVRLARGSEPSVLKATLDRDGHLADFPQAYRLIDLLCNWGDFTTAETCMGWYDQRAKTQLEKYLQGKERQIIHDYAIAARQTTPPVASEEFLASMRVPQSIIDHCQQVERAYRAFALPNQAAVLQRIHALCSQDTELVGYIQEDVASLVIELAAGLQKMSGRKNWAVLSNQAYGKLLTLISEVAATPWFGQVKFPQKEQFVRQASTLSLVRLARTSEPWVLQAVLERGGYLTNFVQADQLVREVYDWDDYSSGALVIEQYRGPDKPKLQKVGEQKLADLIAGYRVAIKGGQNSAAFFQGIRVPEAVKEQCQREIDVVLLQDYQAAREIVTAELLKGDYHKARRELDRLKSTLAKPYQKSLEHFLIVEKVVDDLEEAGIKDPYTISLDKKLAPYDIRGVINRHEVKDVFPLIIESLTEEQLRILLLSLILVDILPPTLVAGAHEFRFDERRNQLIAHIFPRVDFKHKMAAFHPDTVRYQYRQLPPGKQTALTLYMQGASQAIAKKVGPNRDNLSCLEEIDRMATTREKFLNLVAILALILPGVSLKVIEDDVLSHVKAELVGKFSA